MNRDALIVSPASMATGELLFGLLDRHALRRMAGTRSFTRGEAYVTYGQVGFLAEHDGTIAATVQATRSYRVTLWAKDGEVQFSYTCPMGQDGVFCKHDVAIALAWLEQGQAGGAWGRRQLARR